MAVARLRTNWPHLKLYSPQNLCDRELWLISLVILMQLMEHLFIAILKEHGVIQSMAQQGTYGDHLTIQRASQIFNVQFLVVPTLGVDAASIMWLLL